MAQQDWKSVNKGDARYGDASRLVAAPAAGEDLGDALRGAFGCAKDSPTDFDRLLAQLR
jgi:hypothetical protein